MSKFFKALEQAQRDRAIAAQTRVGPAPTEPARETSRPVDGPVKPVVPRTPGVTVRKSLPEPRQAVDFRGEVDDHLVSLVSSSGFEAEQYRALRYMIEQRNKATGLSVIAVSSASVGDGKTTTAINLAGCLAQSPGARILLVEGDLRRPSIATMLGFPDTGRPGLVDAILDKNVALESVIQSRPPFNLDVIVVNQPAASPYEILRSARLGDLIEEARKLYDYVIVDTPPLVQVQDGRVITRWVDGILLVVAANRTPRRLLEEALTAVDPAKMLGLVFNGDSGALSHSGSRHYRGYYLQSESPQNGTGRLGRALQRIGSSFKRQAPPARRTRRGRDRKR